MITITKNSLNQMLKRDIFEEYFDESDAESTPDEEIDLSRSIFDG